MAEYADVAAELGVADELEVPSQDFEGGGGDLINEDVTALHDAWVTESVSPELLPFKRDVVEDMTALIENQEAELEKLQAQDADQAWSASLYTQDLDRIKFALARYLRARLAKIESCAWKYQAGDADFLAKLSDAEEQYARGYVKLLSRHYDETVLNQLPSEFQAFPGSGAGAAENDPFSPDLNTYVFCRVKEDGGGAEVQLDEDTGAHVTLDPESIHVLRYPPVKALVGSELELI
jgi:hypothetical protein